MKFDASVETCDILVAGGGPAGICAATAAARAGARVLLVEMTGSLGGMASNGLVPVLCGYSDGRKIIHRGIALELLNETRAYMGEPAVDADNLSAVTLALRSKGIHFFVEPEAVKYAADRLICHAGVSLMFFSTLCGVEMASPDTVGAVIVANRNGIFRVKAKQFIDCTGDACLCSLAGAETLKGGENGELQPVSLCSVMSGISRQYMEKDTWAKIIVDPEFPLLEDDFFCPFPVGPIARCNGGHLWGLDGSNHADLSKAMVDGREQVKQLRDALRKYVPENKNVQMIQTAELPGIRETRRIVGDYILTAEDYYTRSRFDDEIAINSYYIDTHPSREQRRLEREGSWKWEEQYKLYSEGEFHGIPYRCLTPRGLNNVINAGRTISTDRVANSAIRVMADCMSMGQAAGTAAAILLHEGKSDFHQLDVSKCQAMLKEAGCFLPGKSLIADTAENVMRFGNPSAGNQDRSEHDHETLF